MSFANPDYDSNNLLSDNDHENEYQQLLDTHYKELSLFSPSPTFHTKEKDEEDNYDSQEDDDEEQSESIFKALDEFYVKSDSHQRRRSSQKLRRKYPDIHIDDMGFRTGLEPDLSLGSPTLSSSRDESLPLGWEKHEGTQLVFLAYDSLVQYSRSFPFLIFLIGFCFILDHLHG